MSRLLEKITKGENKKINLICIPYAGGGASMYFAWKDRIHPDVRLWAVQLPGREDRIMDKPYQAIEDVIPDLLSEVKELIEQTGNPCILFGHSMGAKIAFELEKALEEIQKGSSLLIVSGSRAPHIPEPRPICHLENKAFLDELNRFEGTPTEILKNKEMMSFFIPLLRADFTMDEAYVVEQTGKLSCPVVAFCGDKDAEAEESDMKQWEGYAENFKIQIFEGKHFFVKTNLEKVVNAINELVFTMIKE